MKPKLLLPNRYKLIGLLILIPSLVLGIAVYFFEFSFSFLNTRPNEGLNLDPSTDFTDEVALTGMIIGLLLIAFSREKEEDEFINKIRLESLQWAILFNYILLLIATWAVYGLDFIDVMVYNMLTILLIFIIRFHILIWRNDYSAKHPNL